MKTKENEIVVVIIDKHIQSLVSEFVLRDKQATPVISQKGYIWNVSKWKGTIIRLGDNI